MIEIRTFRSKKRLRVDLWRQFREIDPKTGRTKYSYKRLGGFPHETGCPDDLRALLESDENVQLENWFAESKFAEQFDVKADELMKYALNMPPQFCQALIALSQEAKEWQLEFVPNQVILEALLQKAKLVQNKIGKLSSSLCNILERAGIQDAKIITEEANQQLIDQESRALFKALLSLNQPVGKTCTELEEAAHAYGKDKRIPPPQIKEWAGEMPGRNIKIVKKWCYAIAIDVLLKHGINPITLVSPEKVAMYWAIQRQNEYTLKEAQKKFIGVFQITDNEIRNEIMQSIQVVYRNI